MFAKGTTILTGSAVDPRNIPISRPSDLLSERCSQAALRALQAEPELLSPLERMQAPQTYARIQIKRRAQLESFLWVDSNPRILERIIDLVLMICEEPNWSANGASVDDPLHPSIDVQAAETGMLLVWVQHRHGQKLKELCPRLSRVILDALRRRLLAPALTHDDYPFLRGSGSCPALILADLLLCCLLAEVNPSRRLQPVKAFLQLLDRIGTAVPSTGVPYASRLTDACALTDLARLLKRLTRGELDLTREVPSAAWLDDLLIPWITEDCFLDPGGEGMRPDIAPMDLFRLGYLTRYRPLCMLGAQLAQTGDTPAASISGRILSMEYMRAAQDECAPTPKPRRARSEDGSLMLSRMDGLFAAITGKGERANAGAITLFSDAAPIIGDLGGAIHSLPLIGGEMPLARPSAPVAADADFSEDRDLMSMDLTDIYSPDAGLAAYQRTLMTMRSDGTVRLVDAFEFTRIPQSLSFRFSCQQKPLSLRDHVRLGPLTLSWDQDMLPEIAELPSGGYLLSFTLREVPHRLICGFRFELN